MPLIRAIIRRKTLLATAHWCGLQAFFIRQLTRHAGARGVAAGGRIDRTESPDQTGFDRATPDMNDHRTAVNVRQWLVGTARRGKPGGDDDDCGHSVNAGRGETYRHDISSAVRQRQ